MPSQDNQTQVDHRWSFQELTPRRTVCPTNGIRFGPDGRLYAASAFGSAIAKIDVESGKVDMASSLGSSIVSPDDIDFDSNGRLYVAECMDARVTELDSDGHTRVIAEGLTGVNGITVFEDRIFVNECRPEGRFFEVYRDGRPPKLLASGIPFTNGCAVGSNREIYYPRIMSGEVWRMPIDGGDSTLVATGLAGPSAVKIRDGHIYVCEGHSGDVTEIYEDLRPRKVLGHLRPGIDSIELSPDGRIFASHWIDGEIVEIIEGEEPRTVVEPGLIGPYGLAAQSDGTLHVADGCRLLTMANDSELRTTFQSLFDPGMSGMLRGLALSKAGSLLVTSASGEAYRYNIQTRACEVLATKLDEPMGVLEFDDEVLLAEAGTGRVLALDHAGHCRVFAEGLGRPVGLVAVGNAVYVSDSENGTIVEVHADGSNRKIASDLGRPEGLAVLAGKLLVLDAGKRELVEIELQTFAMKLLVSDLPVGAAPAGVFKPRLNGVPEVIPGPFTPFSDVAVGGGRIFITGDANGTVIEIRRSN